MNFDAIFRSLTCGFEASVPLNTFNSAEPRQENLFISGEAGALVVPG